MGEKKLAARVRRLLADWPYPQVEQGDWAALGDLCLQVWKAVHERSPFRASGPALINARIVAWFEAGHTVEALLGGQPYFMPAHTYRDRHDRLLVLRQLAQWARIGDNSSAASTAFMEALLQAALDEDLSSVCDLTWCLLLISGDGGLAIPVDALDLDRLLDIADTVSEPPGEETANMRRRVREALTARSLSSGGPDVDVVAAELRQTVEHLNQGDRGLAAKSVANAAYIVIDTWPLDSTLGAAIVGLSQRLRHEDNGS